MSTETSWRTSEVVQEAYALARLAGTRSDALDKLCDAVAHAAPRTLPGVTDTPLAQDEVTVRLPRKTAENSLVDAMARRDRYQQNMRDLDEGTEGSLMTPEELIYRRELTELIERWEGHCARLQDALEVGASSGSTGPEHREATTLGEHMAIDQGGYTGELCINCKRNRVVRSTMTCEKCEVHQCEYAAKFGPFAGSGSTGAPLDQPTPPLNTELLMRLRQVETYARLLMEENPDLDTPCQYLAAPLRELAAFDHSPAAPLAQPTPTETT